MARRLDNVGVRTTAVALSLTCIHVQRTVEDIISKCRLQYTNKLALDPVAADIGGQCTALYLALCVT